MMSNAKAAADQVKVLKYVKVEQGWRFATVVRQAGLIVPDHVFIRGRDEYHPEGRYYVELHESGNRRRCTIPPYPNIEEAARQRLIEMRAASAQAHRLTFSVAVDRYLNFIEHHRRLSTWRAYRNVLTMFERCYVKPYVDQVQRQDLLDFINCCYKGGFCSTTQRLAAVC